MNMAKKSSLCVWFSLLLFIFTAYSFCFAIDLPIIDKSKIRLSLAEGESGYGEITVQNSSPERKSLRVYLGDWVYLPAADGSKEFLPTGTTPLSCASWVSFSPAELVLEPFSKKKLNYTVKVPPGARGGFYAALFFESVFGKFEAGGQELSAGMNIAVRIATLFYVEVKGSVKRTAAVENLFFEQAADAKGYRVQLDLTNTGNVDITAGGSFHAMDKQGKVYARGEFANVYTFPGNSAKLIAGWKEDLPKGKYDLVFTLDLGKAQEEAGMGQGPVLTKEAVLEIGAKGEVAYIGKLK